jgi:hypothetical protein
MRNNLSTYNPSKQPASFEFYIQNKGYNSGRPKLQPLTNCFVASFNSHEECEEYYWLCYALWQSDMFKPYLKGSVIEFITIDNLAEIIEVHSGLIQLKRARFITALEQVVQIETKKAKIEHSLTALLNLKRQLLRQILS